MKQLGESRRSRVVSWIAGGLACAVVLTVAIVASGYDARETPREEPSVWAMRSSGQYARVNTETAEIDTVRQVEDPNGVVQSGANGVVLSHGNGQAWSIDPIAPADFQEDAGAGAGDGDSATAASSEAPETSDGAGEGALRTPDGTREVLQAGGAVVFRTESGEVHLSRFEGEASAAVPLGQPVLLDPLAGERAETENADEPETFQADAVAINDDGRVAMFSSGRSEVRWYDAKSGEFESGVSQTPEGIPTERLQLAIVGGDWVILDLEGGELWREGRGDAAELDLEGTAMLQASSARAAGADALIADEAGLWSVAPDGDAERIAEADGVPAKPAAVGEHRYAAWIGAGEGAFWNSDSGDTRALELDDAADETGEPDPVILNNGSRALVSEQSSGMMWTVPDGRLIPVEQWSLVDPPKEEQGAIVVNDVTQQEPPVAVDDSFGVRPGEPTLLPVLLNDYDPNRRDVLTVVPDGLGAGLDSDFGSLQMLSDGQGIMITPADDASGTATFRYRITDGIALSEPATVRLTVADDSENSAPAWCPVDGCQREWPSPEMTPGGTLVLPVLEGWVDPQGDPMMLAGAELANDDDPARVLVTADGRMALRHTDANAAEGEIVVSLTVEDSRGESRERDLRVRVRNGAETTFSPIASTVKVGEATTLRPLERVSGGSGSFVLVDAVAQDGGVSVKPNAGTGAIEVSASEAGSSVLSITVRDTVTESETTGVMRITAVEDRGEIGIPPLRAFVRPLADTTVEVLDAIPGANSRALVVRSANVLDGQLRADVIEHARLRVSGATESGEPGRIGSVDVEVAEGEDSATGRMTVFQVPDSAGAIAVADAATVRAGAVVDIDVLDNDVAPPGERLVLHPDVGVSGAKGELAFASGNSLRYLAPKEPGTYTLSYTTYGASSPEASDVGHVRVTVVPREGNREPQPRTLTVRLAPGEQTTTQVPLSNVDPDGDRVRLVNVDVAEDPQLSTMIVPRGSSIQVEASGKAEPGIQTIPYTVRDEFGGEGRGKLRVIITEPDPGAGAPIVYSDYVRLTQGAAEPAVVRPLDNDIDPSNGELELLEVVPNVPGGEDSAQYRKLADRLDASQIKQGRVRIDGGDELGTVSYRYTVRSKETKSTADGLIVVQVSARVGQQAPTVRDTVLSARDRVELERTGIDVVTNRVYWAAGDVSDLKLSLWGNAKNRYSVEGSKIVGKYRAEGDLVPFRLAGKDVTGQEVQSFGFLVIPPLDELRLTLRPGLPPISVDENKSTEVRVNSIVDLAEGDRVELKQGAFPTQRGQARCEATNATTLRYAAGKESPWNDTCTILVRLTEQKAWTQLAVPVQIVPDQPVAELQAMTRTVAPGATETIDLSDMVRWQGGRDGRLSDVRFTVSGGGGAIEVVQSGQRVQATVDANGVPGSQQAVTVTSAGAGESSAQLTLRVGEAPRDTPRGGTVSLQCEVGSNCQTRAIGVAGEHDPFEGKRGSGLELVSVDGGGCTYGRLSVSGDNIVVAWDDPKGPGGQCTASFTVKDAQNRTGVGSVELDARGVPAAPSSLTAVAYDRNSVTLEAQLNSSVRAHPAVTGVKIVGGPGSSSDSCTGSGATYRCVVSGLENGRQHSFTAVAVNGVGDSRPSNAVTAWAYEAPSRPTVTSTQVSAESSSRATAKLSIEGRSDTASYRIVTQAGETTASGQNATPTISGLPVGSSNYTVIPVSRFKPPTNAHSVEGSAAEGTFRLGGRPTVSISDARSEPLSRSVKFTINVDARGGSAVEAGFSANGDCRPGNAGSGGPQQADGLRRFKVAEITVCARNEWGSADNTDSAKVLVGGKVPDLGLRSGYTMQQDPSLSGGIYTYELASQPTFSGKLDEAEIRFSNGDVNTLSLTTSSPMNISAVQCLDDSCSERSVAVEPARGHPRIPISVTPTNGECVVGETDYRTLVTIAGGATADNASFSADSATGNLTVSWPGFSGLNPLTFNAGCADPEPEEPPEPEPEEGP
ncbi:Ig-like domain-containing protein [Leucobacter sp. GX24907]